MNTETKEIVKNEFLELIQEGKYGDTPFDKMVLKWMCFCLKLVVIHNIRSNEAVNSRPIFNNHMVCNENDDILPSLGKCFEKTCVAQKDNRILFKSLLDLKYFFDLYTRFKDPKVRLCKLTKNPMSDFFIYANYVEGGTLEFLLNINPKEFLTLSELTEKETSFEYFEQEKLTEIFREQLLEKNKMVEDLIESIISYPNKYPGKEIMYGWMLKKYPKISTSKLVEYSKKTRSEAIIEAVMNRPDDELPFDMLVLKKRSKKAA